MELFTLVHPSGLRVRIMTHGGTVVSLETPDRHGRLADIVLGHDRAADYTPETPYFGCITGRYANRIKNGRFVLNGTVYALPVNNHPNTLHGGIRGFDKAVWAGEVLPGESAVRLTYLSADGEEGFPGEVETAVTYTLTASGELKIDYQAESSKPTPFNITNHSYFNLAGHAAGFCGRQLVTINADRFLPVDETSIPYGQEASVAGTPFDFRTPHAIGGRIDAEDEQLRFGNGYDHTFCLNKTNPGELSFAARAEDPDSGRTVEVYTTEPGVQFYTGNYLSGAPQGKGGCSYVRRGGFCFETQHYPDSPNQPQFPDTILRPGQTFRSQTIYKFL